MCWKCCLCMCTCSQAATDAEQTNADINRMIDSDQAKLKTLKVRSVEDKNWQPFNLAGTTYFVHGSGTGPAIIRKSGSLDPAFGRESCLVNGIAGKYLLAFACEGNLVPDTMKLKGAAAMLWGVKEFPYIYIFHVPGGTQVFQSPVANGPVQTAARLSAETGFDTAVPWGQVDRVFQYDFDTDKYEHNRNFDQVDQ